MATANSTWLWDFSISAPRQAVSPSSSATETAPSRVQAKHPLDSPAPPRSRPGDANGDGTVDLIASTTGGFTIALGKGDGTFQAPASYSGLIDTFSLAVGDLNGDDKLDIAAAQRFVVHHFRRRPA